jgi:hypothetical protein
MTEINTNIWKIYPIYIIRVDTDDGSRTSLRNIEFYLSHNAPEKNCQSHAQGVAYYFSAGDIALFRTHGTNVKATLRDRQYSHFGSLGTHLGSDKLQESSS